MPTRGRLLFMLRGAARRDSKTKEARDTLPQKGALAEQRPVPEKLEEACRQCGRPAEESLLQSFANREWDVSAPRPNYLASQSPGFSVSRGYYFWRGGPARGRRRHVFGDR
jgi:hypothetical protein